MATTVHYISQTVPGAGLLLKGVNTNNPAIPSNVSGTTNINDGALASTSPSTDPIGFWWTDTGVLATRVTKKQVVMFLKDLIRFIEKGGNRLSGASGQDSHVPT